MPRRFLDVASSNTFPANVRATTDSVDAKISREVFDLAGGKAGLALGLELRREKLQFTPSALLAAGEIRGDGAAVGYGGERTVKADYAELNLPFLKTLEVQAALRHDAYNDVGSSTNPKLGIRWNPSAALVLRGSFGRDFRAPTLADLHEPARPGRPEFARHSRPDFVGGRAGEKHRLAQNLGD